MTNYLRFSDLKARGIVGNRMTLARWIQSQGFPAAIKLGPNLVAWREDEIEAWLTERELATTASRKATQFPIFAMARFLHLPP